MKFFATLILPMEADISDRKSVERFSAEMMRPFKMWEDDIPAENGCWDYYWCCTKEWMEESRIGYSSYRGIPAGQPFVLFPADRITAEGVTDSIVTPNGEWLRSKASYTEDDPSWTASAIGICRSFPGHFAVLAYCHG